MVSSDGVGQRLAEHGGGFAQSELVLASRGRAVRGHASGANADARESAVSPSDAGGWSRVSERYLVPCRKRSSLWTVYLYAGGNNDAKERGRIRPNSPINRRPGAPAGRPSVVARGDCARPVARCRRPTGRGDSDRDGPDPEVSGQQSPRDEHLPAGGRIRRARDRDAAMSLSIY